MVTIKGLSCLFFIRMLDLTELLLSRDNHVRKLAELKSLKAPQFKKAVLQGALAISSEIYFKEL